MASDHRIDTKRIPWSIAAGALAGATIVAAPTLVLSLIYDSIERFLRFNLQMVVATFVVAFMVWAIGLVVVGLPLWWLFHKKGLWRWWAAVLCGAIAAFVGAFALELALTLSIEHSSFSDSGGYTMIDGEVTAYGWRSLVLGAVETGVYGAIVAAVIWRIAYRRVNQPA
jgi:amino acid transporter